MFQTIIHAMQLESAYQWYQHNSNEECARNLADRSKWFAAMKRINCVICERPLESEPS